jgi:hypothetical protein
VPRLWAIARWPRLGVGKNFSPLILPQAAGVIRQVVSAALRNRSRSFSVARSLRDAFVTRPSRTG